MFPADIAALASRYLVLCTPCLFLTTAISMLVTNGFQMHVPCRHCCAGQPLPGAVHALPVPDHCHLHACY
jgi:hypothetical protein